MTIDLGPDLEQRLDDFARRKGTTPESLVRSAVEQLLAPAKAEEDTPTPGSLAELLQGYAGVFDSREWVPGGARLSENTGEKFTDILVEKRAQGHL
jgi:predicted transcriptional regulator